MIRYATAADHAEPPRILPIIPANMDVAVLAEPGAADNALRRPGQCLVLRASRQIEVEIEIRPFRPGSSLEASVRVEYLTEQAPRPRVAATRPVAPVDTSSLMLQGHVSRMGDVRVRANQWLAGPQNPGRIEGITLSWDGKPRDLDLRYGVQMAGMAPDAVNAVGLGEFAGSKGRSRPLTGVLFELSGSASASAELVVEALFLGGPTLVQRGRRVRLSGASGEEPLVGLRIQVENAEAKALDARSEGPAASASRLQVFKSQQ
ncbi:hypothetical protein [Aurantimonas sp. VKM B-3413]|uniref:hypothetical protein n=1 Tax=Aurantimonas sp. VKM B-3413 TaxID=2779401 RepID=UPI001E376CC0|nr:hypothetical protein [Aurantimonas sp. VKM B-3413]MCB8839373.1 hypothetical protein [Aurantimonas sp. VKM B-3413]